ncbi:MAG: WcbI family polysaccharide biosynthesis putative acetyltransferase [Terricaulis sp.]
MRIAVIGNCQARPFRHCLEALAGPFDDAVTINVANAETHRAILADRDLIFAQPDLPQTLSDEHQAKLVTYPKLSTSSFHPDCRVFHTDGGGFIDGPLRQFHSLIIAAGYLEGLSPPRIEKLFNAYVYARLGYMDRVNLHLETLIKHCLSQNYDFTGFVRDTQQEAFMFTPNHPRVSILYIAAQQALQRCGVKAKANARPPADEIDRNFFWPFYPEIAAQSGRRGSEMIFRNFTEAFDLNALIPLYCKYYAEHGAPGGDRVEAARRVLRQELAL